MCNELVFWRLKGEKEGEVGSDDEPIGALDAVLLHD